MKFRIFVLSLAGIAIAVAGNETHDEGDSACSEPCADINQGEHCHEQS